jgi:hypothetical protein
VRFNLRATTARRTTSQRRRKQRQQQEHSDALKLTYGHVDMMHPDNGFPVKIYDAAVREQHDKHVGQRTTIFNSITPTSA